MQEKRFSQRGFTLLELVVVSVVIAILSVSGLSYYQQIVEDSRRTGLEVLAHRFTSSVALVHAQWILQGGHNSGSSMTLDVDGLAIVVNERGWPVGNRRARVVNAENCYQIWQTLLQNPAQATVDGVGFGGDDEAQTRGRHRYHISSPGIDSCRYEMVSTNVDSHFFDYNARTGQVHLRVPDFTKL